MTDIPPDIERAADLAASHAMVLLGAGVLLLAAAAWLVVAVVRVSGRCAPVLWQRVRGFIPYLERMPFLTEVAQRTERARRRLATGYLAVHLAGGLAASLALAGFIVLAVEVGTRGELAAFDAAFAAALVASTSPDWRELFERVTWLGSTPALAAASAGVAAWLFARRRSLLAVGWIVGQGGGGLLNLALKAMFTRTRPEYADAALTGSWSFPSGHAMGTLVFCGIGIYVFVRTRHERPVTLVRLVTLIVLSAAWCLIMSFSRLYLGAHFLSDVLAGLLAGVAWVAVCVSGMEIALRRR